MNHVPFLSAVTLAMLAGCASQPPRPAPDQCNLAIHSDLVGQNHGAITLPPALPQRVISPGQMVTMDYNAARLNLYVDEKGWIQRVTCG